jgi:metal-dependent hydrolase (beta-lactamase superfamily II)
MGGFQLLDKSVSEINMLRELGIKHVEPAHCTGKEATEKFQEPCKANCIDVEVGKTMEV